MQMLIGPIFLLEHFVASAPIETGCVTSLPFQEIMTDRPARRGGPTDQPTDGHESS